MPIVDINKCTFLSPSIFVGVPLLALFDLYQKYVVCNVVVRNKPPKLVESVQIFCRIVAEFGHFR